MPFNLVTQKKRRLMYTRKKNTLVYNPREIEKTGTDGLQVWRTAHHAGLGTGAGSA
jgi:hypothetical protein